MMLVLPDGRGRQSYNGSIRFAPAPGPKSSCAQRETAKWGTAALGTVNSGMTNLAIMAGSGPVEERVDRGAGLGDAVMERRQGMRGVGLAPHGDFQPFGGLGVAERAARPRRATQSLG